MKYLLEIAKILTRKKIAKIEILDETTLKNTDSLFAKFYKLLLTNHIRTDEEAVQHLYENESISTGDPRYRQLKSRFRRRLMNTLFFVDINAPLAPDYAKARFNANKEWALVEIMIAYDARFPATYFARQILTTALKFRLIDLIIKCSRMLREQSVLEENTRDFEQYNHYIEQYTPILAGENQAEALMQRAMLQYYTMHFEPQNLAQIKEILDQLIRLSEEISSPSINYCMYVVWVLNLELIQEYDDLLAVCKEASTFLQNQINFFTQEQKVFFYNKELLVYLHLQQFNHGKSLMAAVLQSSFESGSNAWFEFVEYFMLLSFHTENYLAAFDLFGRIVGSPTFKELDGIRKEKWDLIEIFLNYLIQSGKAEANWMSRQRQRLFNESEYIERSINYSTKEATLTIHHLVFQMLFLLNRRSNANFQERMKQLKRLQRYELKKTGYHRASNFVRLLLQMEKADYQLTNLRDEHSYLEDLNQISFFYRGKLAGFELILYEQLWKEFTSYLE